MSTSTHPRDLEIMMPFWGRFDHLQEAVESVLAQTDQAWHLTVVDDVYPDTAPGEWVAHIGDPRITYVRNEVNLRPSRNYNKCVGIATADYLTLLGCDDVLGPDYVARVRELLALFPDADVIQPGVSIIDGDGRASRPLGDRVKSSMAPRGERPGVFAGESVASSLLQGNWTYFPSLVWRRSWLVDHPFNVDLDVVQDLEMLLDIVMAGGAIAIDDRRIFHYRRHSTSVSAVTGPDGSKFAQERTLFRAVQRRSEELGWRKAARAARMHATSRLNAVMALPTAARARNWSAVRSIVRHVVVPGARP